MRLSNLFNPSFFGSATCLALVVSACTVIAGQPQDPNETAKAAERLAEANRLYAEGQVSYQAEDFAKAAQLYEQAYDAGATAAAVPYNTACCFARLGKVDDAFKWLNLAIDRGWRNLEHLKKDTDFESVHSDKRWEEAVARCAEKRDAFRKAQGAPDLYDELMRRMNVDQTARLTIKPGAPALDVLRIDADNTAWMKQVIEKHGWPGFALVGRDGALAAWLLVQHADADTAFQRQCLTLLTSAYEKGDASAQNVAYLTDRVLLAEGKPQVYGTQFHTVDGKLQPRPIENEAEVDQRRAKMGLEPIAEYAKQMQAQN